MVFSVGKILLGILGLILLIVIGFYVYLAFRDQHRGNIFQRCGPAKVGRTKSQGYVTVRHCHRRSSAVRVDAKGKVPYGMVVEPSSGLLVNKYGHEGRRIIKRHEYQQEKIDKQIAKSERSRQKQMGKAQRHMEKETGGPVYLKNVSGNSQHTQLTYSTSPSDRSSDYY